MKASELIERLNELREVSEDDPEVVVSCGTCDGKPAFEVAAAQLIKDNENQYIIIKSIDGRVQIY